MFGELFKGSMHRANAERLEVELQVATQKFSDLEAKVRQNGMLDLVEIQMKLRSEVSLLASIRGQVSAAKEELSAARIQQQNELQDASAKIHEVQQEARTKLYAEINAERATHQSDMQIERSKYQNEMYDARTKLKELQEQLLGVEDRVLLESFALYEPKYQLTNSAEYKKLLDEIRGYQKNTARGISKMVDSWDNFAVNFTKADWKKLRKDVLKLSLRAFNSECDNCIENVKFNNVDRMELRIRKSFEVCNKLLQACEVFWNEVVLEQKLSELHLAHEYQVKRQDEKEAARQAREEQREQEKLEKEIREARAKIEKERQHFAGAIQKLQLRLAAAGTENERSELQVRIAELASQHGKLDEEEKLLDYREQNARAGYVYVISNVGAFGEGVFKLGMTRRLEPMDRVDELGDASVPFRFDVHALVFSDNAPALEAKLHSHFAAGRLNKVNGRKEFFRADLMEIESVIRANYDAVVEVVHTAPAEQYRESLLMAMPQTSNASFVPASIATE